MEEEEEKRKKVEEISEKDLDASRGASVVQDRVETSNLENINVIGSGETEIGSNNVVAQGIDYVSEIVDEEYFEQVFLKDQDNGRFSYGEIEEISHRSEYDSSQNTELRRDRSILSPRPEVPAGYAMNQSFSSRSLDSYYYGDAGYSPMGSPPKTKRKIAMPNDSPELLHLVDSAIMGKPESLDKLKNIVSGVGSFGTGEEAKSIAFLVVDSLLATMGGVESFEDEDNNPPSVMLNSRAAIVAGDLIPWLPWVGDSKMYMSPRTRMIRGLLAILKACTRNRAMCSVAGLLGVLLGSAEKIFTQDVDYPEHLRWDGTSLCNCFQYLAGHSLS